LYSAIVSTLRDLGVNLKSGVRLAFWRRLVGADFRVSPDQLVLLALLQLPLNIAVSLAANGADGYLDWEALPIVAFPLVLLLAAAYLVAKIYSRDRIALELPIVLLAATPAFTVVFSVQELLAREAVVEAGGAFSEYALHLVCVVWVVVVCIAGLIVVAGRDRRRLAGAAVVLFLCTIVPQVFLPYRDLWAPNEEIVLEDDLPSVASEEAINLQPALLEHALAALAPERPGVVDLYFVGFAPFDEQDVFMQEASAARALIEERFDARGRAVTLVNNHRTVMEQPIATVSNLAATLARVGETMNPEEDILFLFLTSHGRPSALEVRFDPLELNPLYPAVLRHALDDARIKWRVIVISACYSGSFVGPLQDERTLIITAADGENPSFGCSNDADLTYFGRAYFGEHLKATYSFEEAYRRAANTIGLWETGKGYAQSRPQIHVGSAIAEKLKAFESRFRVAAAAAPGTLP
jgi:hypothetical protein